VSDSAKRTIDADGLVVAPGFVDPHTHYDAQICWDGAVTPSSWHGVTSVVMGNCGVGIAPCKPAAREIAMKDIVNVEGIPFDVLEQDQCELLDFLLTESGRPVTFIALFDRDDIPEAVRDTLRRAAPMIAKGARPQTSPLPLTREVDMKNPFSFAAFPSWKRVFADKSKRAQKAVYRDPAFRNQFREELKNPMGFGNWERITLHEVRSPELKRFEGMTVAEIGRAEGKDGVD